jgi:hypothetical protein
VTGTKETINADFCFSIRENPLESLKSAYKRKSAKIVKRFEDENTPPTSVADTIPGLKPGLGRPGPGSSQSSRAGCISG